ncbi:hypothetical protein J2W42_002985 [Rhizobium tibeticum]|nr:hypothetical protein [Rhizobium tibeticum]
MLATIENDQQAFVGDEGQQFGDWIGATNHTAGRRDDGARNQGAFGNGAEVDKDDVLVVEFSSQPLDNGRSNRRLADASRSDDADEPTRQKEFAQAADEGLPTDQRSGWRWHTTCG